MMDVFEPTLKQLPA